MLLRKKTQLSSLLDENIGTPDQIGLTALNMHIEKYNNCVAKIMHFLEMLDRLDEALSIASMYARSSYFNGKLQGLSARAITETQLSNLSPGTRKKAERVLRSAKGEKMFSSESPKGGSVTRKRM